MAAMADGFTSADDLPPYVLDRLFDSFSDESLSDVDDRNNNDNDNVNDVCELSDRARDETETDSGTIFDGYSDLSDDECDGVNAEMSYALYYQCWMMCSLIFVRRKMFL